MSFFKLMILFLLMFYFFNFSISSSLNTIIKIEDIDFCDIVDNDVAVDFNELLNYNLSDIEINNYANFLHEFKNKTKFFDSNEFKKSLNYADPRIINLGVDPVLIDNLRNELHQANLFAKELEYYIPETSTPTSFFDTKFVLVGYMLPSLPKLLRQTKNTILEVIPGFKKLIVNAFLVEKGAKSERIHNQGNHNILNNFKVFHDDIWANVMNIHIALNDLNEKRQPFIFFPKTDKEIVTPRYAYKYLMENGYIKPNETLIYERALFLAENGWEYDKLQLKDRIHPGAFTLLKTYYKKRYCSESVREEKAQIFWGNVTKGNALVFSPFMLHGGSIFPPAEEARYSLVLRNCDKDDCAPWSKIIEQDKGIFLNAIYKGINTYKKLRAYNKLNVCYKKIFNYPDDSKKDLLAFRAFGMDLDTIIDFMEDHYNQEYTKEWLKNPKVSNDLLICIKEFYGDHLGKEIEVKEIKVKRIGENKNHNINEEGNNEKEL